jgi:hypothetical protein
VLRVREAGSFLDRDRFVLSLLFFFRVVDVLHHALMGVLLQLDVLTLVVAFYPKFEVA